jgi:surface carbohydrate biosynthesis protein
MKKNIYFLIENIRELEPKILLSLTAVKKGMEVAITKKSRLFEKLHLIRPGIIFLKSFGRNYDLHLKKINTFGHILTGFDEEGLQLYDENKLVGDRFSKNVMNKLNFIFSNGDYAKKIYMEYFKKENRNITVISSGHPKIEFLKRKLLKYHSKKIKKIKKKFGKYILIATQFPFYNANTINLVKNPKYSPWLNVKKVSFRSKTGDSTKNKVKTFLHQKKNFLEYLKLYNYLNKNFPDIKFLIKPHPVENHNYYNQIIEKNKFSNIQILNTTKSIIPYIQASEALIAFNSTSLVESFILKKTSINHIPYKDNFSEFKLTKLLSINSNNLNTIGKIFRNNLYKKRNYVSKKNINAAKKILKNLTNGDAVNTIIKKIMSIETNPNKVDNKNQNYINFIYFFLKTKTISLFNYFFYRNKMLYKVQIDKREGLNKAQIQAKVDDLSKIIYPGTKFIVKEKYYGIYYIEKYQS